MAVFNVYRAPNGYLLSPETRIQEPRVRCMWLGVMASDRFSEGLQQQIHDGLENAEFATLTVEQFYDQHPDNP